MNTLYYNENTECIFLQANPIEEQAKICLKKQHHHR